MQATSFFPSAARNQHQSKQSETSSAAQDEYILPLNTHHPQRLKSFSNFIWHLSKLNADSFNYLFVMLGWFEFSSLLIWLSSRKKPGYFPCQTKKVGEAHCGRMWTTFIMWHIFLVYLPLSPTVFKKLILRYLGQISFWKSVIFIQASSFANNHKSLVPRYVDLFKRTADVKTHPNVWSPDGKALWALASISDARRRCRPGPPARPSASPSWWWSPGNASTIRQHWDSSAVFNYDQFSFVSLHYNHNHNVYYNTQPWIFMWCQTYEMFN